MAKLVSQKREIKVIDTGSDELTEPRSTAAASALGYFLVALFIVGAIALVVMAFNYRPA
jgi:hypothetical protein